MAGLSDKQTPSLGPWPTGVDNLNREDDLTKDDKGRTIALREVVNLDIPRSGMPETRPGYAKVVELEDGHSGWHGGHFPFVLFADGDSQYAWTTGQTPFLVRDALALRDISYALPNDDKVYCSNGQQAWCVTAGGDALPWCVETPAGQPLAVISSAGGFDGGKYQYAITYLDAAGEESGTGLPVQIDVPDKAGITLTNIPQPVGTNVAKVRAYLSGANGTVLYMARDIPLGQTVAVLSPQPTKRPLATLAFSPLPPGNIVRALGGRLYSVIGNVQRWSEPLRYGLTNLAKNYREIGESVIDMMEPVGEGGDAPGMFVADYSERTGKGRTYWFGGEHADAQNMTVKYPYGAIPGSSCVVPASMFGLETSLPVAYWIARNGIAMLGLPGGQIVPVKPTARDQAVAPNAVKAASLFRERNGIRHIITTMMNPMRQGLAMGDSASAKVYRNGVQIDDEGNPI